MRTSDDGSVLPTVHDYLCGTVSRAKSRDWPGLPTTPPGTVSGAPRRNRESVGERRRWGHARSNVHEYIQKKKVRHRLGTTSPSSQLLWVANGTVIRSEARWKGRIEVAGVSTEVTFEVFDSGGKWDFLFRKTLLEAFKAIHNYEQDTITLHGNRKKTTISNQSYITTQTQKQIQPTAPICVVSVMR